VSTRTIGAVYFKTTYIYIYVAKCPGTHGGIIGETDLNYRTLSVDMNRFRAFVTNTALSHVAAISKTSSLLTISPNWVKVNISLSAEVRDKHLCWTYEHTLPYPSDNIPVLTCRCTRAIRPRLLFYAPSVAVLFILRSPAMLCFGSEGCGQEQGVRAILGALLHYIWYPM
jgi:hypothetical protein